MHAGRMGHACDRCGSAGCGGQSDIENCSPENCPRCKLLGHHCPWHHKAEEPEFWVPGSSLFQGGVEPPQPKFHPVPTRNVFAPRPDSPPAILPATTGVYGEPLAPMPTMAQ